MGGSNSILLLNLLCCVTAAAQCENRRHIWRRKPFHQDACCRALCLCSFFFFPARFLPESYFTFYCGLPNITGHFSRILFGCEGRKSSHLFL